MHDHDQNKPGSGMIWAMMICCALPVLAILIFGVGGKALGASNWLILGGIAVLMTIHFIKMGRSHKSNSEENMSDKDGHKDSKDHKDHGCCH